MTGRAVFGHFLDTARGHLGAADRLRWAVGGESDVQEVNHSLLRIVALMRGYVQDVTPGWIPERARRGVALTAWARAGADAREALSNAAASLHRRDQGWPGPGGPDSMMAWRLHAASVSLAAGRDLLQSHLARGPGGERELHSDWALAVTSPTVARAVLAETGSLARQIAPLGAAIALAPGSHGTPEARRSLNAASQWLWVLNASVDAAQRQEPMRVSELELLRAIPAAAPPPRRLPTRAEPVAGLCRGVITSAERVRHAAWVSGRQAASSPDLTINSLRRVAATSTVTSHHCDILLRTLASHVAGHSQVDHATGLLQAADAARHTRESWLRVAHTLDRVTTDTRLQLSHQATESADLALWTGRLAYADPAWTLAKGPAHQGRPADSLVPGPGDLPLAVAAVHHACDTLTSLAYTQREQIRAAGAAQRLLVPTRSLPEAIDVPRPFAPAPPERINSLVSACDQTARSADAATASVAAIAAAIGAPSRVLTAAKEAADPTRSGLGPGETAARARDATDRWAFPHEVPDLPGPVERTLHYLGVKNTELLRHGADIDRAGERLIIDAAASLEPQSNRPGATTLSRSVGTATLVNHALAADPSAAALLRGPASPQRESPEAEP